MNSGSLDKHNMHCSRFPMASHESPFKAEGFWLKPRMDRYHTEMIGGATPQPKKNPDRLKGD